MFCLLWVCHCEDDAVSIISRSKLRISDLGSVCFFFFNVEKLSLFSRL